MEHIAHTDVAEARSRDVAALARFIVRHGGFGTAVIEPLGAIGARIVVIGDDGVWSECLTPSVKSAEAACRAAKIPVAPEWNRSLTRIMRLCTTSRSQS